MTGGIPFANRLVMQRNAVASTVALSAVENTRIPACRMTPTEELIGTPASCCRSPPYELRSVKGASGSAQAYGLGGNWASGVPAWRLGWWVMRAVSRTRTSSVLIRRRVARCADRSETSEAIAR